MARAAQELSEGIARRLQEAGVTHGAVTAKSTPRRLVAAIADVAERQPDQEAVMRGPSLKAAYDGDGSPTKALEGFCRGQGASVADVTDDGEYVWVTKRTSGKATVELLSGFLPAAVSDIVWPKTMRWADGTLRFARPVRWILASFGSSVVPVTYEGLVAGLTSR